MFYIDKNTELTTEHIIKFIEVFKTSYLPRLKKLEQYYKNENNIKQRTFKDATKPNNKIAHSWGNYITDSMTAFFIGVPVSYSGNDKDLKLLQEIFDDNDEQDLNSQLARDCSIYGVAYELAYLDENADLRFTKLSPLNTICIYDDSVNSNLLHVIRFNETTNILDNKTTMTIDLYSDLSIKSYKKMDSCALEFINETQHSFELVPISIFKNNDDMLGDFELVIDLIDFYDTLESDMANAFDYYNDCYMVFTGATLPEDIQTMKEERLLEIPEGGIVSFLTKNAMDTELENAKNRIVDDVHKFSRVPNMSDENFANNVSGVAMRYKLLGLESVCAIKERKFKRGLQNRLWLISNILNLKVGTALQDIGIIFKRNIPQNEKEIADMVNSLRGLLSSETLISQLPFVKNANEEVQKLKDEQSLNSYAGLFEHLEVTEDEQQ
ncbi:phage portal protein [Sedimentibacter hydroxybenzoicus DSM 7310]|uniref:Phage portal protein n=1 Tax=Sedimentibacter hydroxybenzoicus DSM 7310 TaxID=1123245 RepID=A0A974GVI6_SEDHY|nr:phage portal protein [Sedimentibacter hydroxybenzoicus]NYB73403.1 phage portal protein [Sedimentibacter hydroxybenzoicus DSM 7310]